MRHLKIFITLSYLTISLTSCTINYWAYIRNLTRKTALIDVFLNDLDDFKVRPTNLKTADEIVKFKKGHKNKFIDTTTISWLDSSHLQFQVRPNTTIDLEAISFFYYSHPMTDMKVVVTTENNIDTLMTSKSDFRRDKFQYKQNGIITPRPILYYDIKE